MLAWNNQGVEFLDGFCLVTRVISFSPLENQYPGNGNFKIRIQPERENPHEKPARVDLASSLCKLLVISFTCRADTYMVL